MLLYKSNDTRGEKMQNLVIIGASELQLPLIKAAKEMGYDTHVFAWNEGAVGFEYITKFYPISIVEIDAIYDIVKDLNPVGICSIASDLANVTVHELSKRLGLPCNSDFCIKASTNKFEMRNAFKKAGVSVPNFKKVRHAGDIRLEEFSFPVIVKPTDRSGSRAITKVEKYCDLEQAITNAVEQSFEKMAIVEEFIEGEEYSCECLSFKGKHYFLNITKKFTTGAPNYIETGHLEPAGFSEEDVESIKNQIFKALDALDIRLGASHSEFKYNKQTGEIKIIEIGSRMGGDYIGSHLVKYSTGVDFCKAVVDCACGTFKGFRKSLETYNYVCVKFCFTQDDYVLLKSIDSKNVIQSTITQPTDRKVMDSSTRFGSCIMHFENEHEAMIVLGHV